MQCWPGDSGKVQAYVHIYTWVCSNDGLLVAAGHHTVTVGVKGHSNIHSKDDYSTQQERNNLMRTTILKCSTYHRSGNYRIPFLHRNC